MSMKLKICPTYFVTGVEISVNKFMELAVPGFTTKDVGGIWICEPSVAVVSDSVENEVCDEFASEMFGEITERLGGRPSSSSLDKLSAVGGKECGGFDNEPTYEQGRGAADKRALTELVLKNVMMARNDSERLVKTFLVLKIYPSLFSGCESLSALFVE